MPYVFKIDDDLGCVFVKWRGLVTLTENETFFMDVEEAPEFRPGLHRLHDFRDAEIDYTAADVRAVLRDDTVAGDRHGFRKVAMLVSSDLAFGISRMYQMLSDDPNQDFFSFRRLDDAMAWLGLPDGLEDPFGKL